MLSKPLAKEVEAFARDMVERNALFARARAGRLKTPQVAAYLQNLKFSFRATMHVLELAAGQSQARGLSELAEYYRRKRMEEDGHDAWPEADLAALRDILNEAQGSHDAPLPAMARLIEDNKQAIRQDPRSYLAHILFAEYITVLVGPTWLELLENRCGISRLAMTAISNHVVLDQDHVQEGVRELDHFVADASALAPLRHTMRQSMEHFWSFCTQVSGV